MPKIARNYTLEGLKPVNKESIERFRAIKQDRHGMKITPVDMVRLEIGLSLIPLCDENLDFNLLKRLMKMRKDIEKETGISIPPIHILDNTELKQFEYSFFIRGKKVAKYEIKQNKYLCLDDGTVKHKVEGKNIKDPVLGVPAILINKSKIKEASDAGYVIADAPCIIMTHIMHLIKENIPELLTYDKSINFLKKVKEENPLLVEECYSKFRPIEIKKILSIILEKKKTLLNIDKILELLILYSNDDYNFEEIAKSIIKEI
jgi:flagellar biosynthesis protein FlhA